MNIRILCLVSLGNFIGGIARYLTTSMMARFSGTLPMGTLFANVPGSLLTGCFTDYPQGLYG